MLKQFLFSLVLILAFTACKRGGEPASEAVKSDGTVMQYFGDKIDESGTISFPELLERMDGVDSLPAKVSGTIAEVCAVKGCWMNIAMEGKENMFVQFKDYGFFMPLDCSGKKAVMDGYAYRAMTSVEDLKHYAEDEGKSQEEIDAITEPKEELKFLASGVILLDK